MLPDPQLEHIIDQITGILLKKELNRNTTQEKIITENSEKSLNNVSFFLFLTLAYS